jgi:hypothetical protein
LGGDVRVRDRPFVRGLRDRYDRSGDDEPLDQPGIATGGDRRHPKRYCDCAGRELSVAGCADRERQCSADDGGELYNDCSEYQRHNAGAAGGPAVAGAEFRRSPVEPGCAYGDERA